MHAFTLSIIAAAASDDINGPAVVFFKWIGIAVVIVVAGILFSRRNRKSVEAATAGLVDAVAFVIAPAPPLPESIIQVRSLLGETSAPPAITRYTRPVVTVSATGVTISDKRLGLLVSIPAADIAGVEARLSTIKPKGAIVARKFPAVWITVRRAAAEAVIAVAPIDGQYEKVSLEQAQVFAREVARRVGLVPN